MASTGPNRQTRVRSSAAATRSGPAPSVPIRTRSAREANRTYAASIASHRAVALQMIRLDVVHHRDRGRRGQERLVVLVRFDDEQVGPAHPGIAAPGGHPPTGQAGRIEMAPTSASVVITVVVVLP
ncbi:MAG: hypothetical protein R2882_05615 [Gemmatimonadales bacterium]